MTIDYTKIAIGSSNTGGLAKFPYVNPWVDLIQPGIIRVPMSLVSSEDGSRSVVLRWTPKITNTVKVAILAAGGLTGVSVAGVAVTLHLATNEDRNTFSNFNATLSYPRTDRFKGGGWLGFELYAIGLVAL